MRPNPRVWTLTKTRNTTLVAAVVAFRIFSRATAFSRCASCVHSRSSFPFRLYRRAYTARFSTMPSIGGDLDHTSNMFPNLKILDSDDLVHYYENTKQILLSLEDGSSHDHNSTNTGNQTRQIKVFSLQYLEPRHRKSMMRCVLNNFHSDGNTNNRSRRVAISKVEFQHRLRLVERRQRWRMTRRLLFGDECVGDADGSSSSDAQQRHWWESGVISVDNAPGLVEGIHQYKNSWHRGCDMPVEEDRENPKKFLSRLARGRTYKGNFRTILEDLISANSQNSREEDLISLYDRIVGDKSKTKSTCDETNQHELELLRLFVDELEAERETTDKVHIGDDSDISSSVSGSCLIATVPEQIALLRTICELDIFSSPSPTLASSPDGSPAICDGGRSVGKRGERDLQTFLAGNQEGRNLDSSETSSEMRVLSPVWVRPKHKNRRITKQKCRYVLEVPTTAQTISSGTTKTNGSLASGSTSEFDAMIVRVIGDIEDCDKGSSQIMVIREVWDAKATLDPSALLDVLDKKVGSLQKILTDVNSRVVNISGSSFVVGDEMSSVATNQNYNADKNSTDGANFVVLPHFDSKKSTSSNDEDHTSASCCNSPIIYRVGTESNELTNDDFGTYAQFPQIGIFASRMIGSRAAARRIQTMVYERLLETDFATVKGVIHDHQRRSRNAKLDNDHTSTLGGDIENGENDPLRCNRLVRDKSVKIVEHLLYFIKELGPIVVVGTLS